LAPVRPPCQQLVMSRHNAENSQHPGHQPWDVGLMPELKNLCLQVDPESIDSSIPAITNSLHYYGFALLNGLGSEAGKSMISQRLIKLSNHLGRIVPQSPRGEQIEDVRDFTDVDISDDRGYRSPGRLSPHSDPPTIILLHCLQCARSGGESEIVNVGSIYREMNRRDPDSVEQLFNKFPVWEVEGSQGRAAAGPAASQRSILARHNGLISCVLYRPFTEMAADHLGVPLTSEQAQALDLFESCANNRALALKFTLQPGVTMLLHNRTVLHARTEYTDWPQPEKRRHLLRTWIDAPDLLPVAPEHELGDIFGDVKLN
jgi:alpha-ketoglutarate-dependent taurine dioxygenase